MKHLKLVSGHGEIKRIDGQIQKALEVMDNLLTPIIERGDDEVDMYRKLLRYQDKINELGFKPCHSTGVTFLGKRQVIKFSYSISICHIPPLKHRVPTLVYHFDENRWKKYNYHVTIQPKVKMFDIDTEPWPKYLEGYGDSHEENIAWYKNKRVLIDW